ncbi:helix-turn-helix domain-containing protein [Lactobacillus delbrueckii subsp. bulgaricus]|uniref:ORF 135 n=1 Tax=Lactococcus phage mv4 TaxID=12392 RepID=Q9G0D0_BPMV4|nr:helix-turn-helix transcriptional regulator [Lactobacillus delbrueckii]AAG31337.1 ORF 135 [Lactobacillus phage mv4]MCD5482380.1 helix-turn-helix domain-containing protein [Lactobacillus delbrueckii subsp. bulgaricus]MCD5482432.1 helix-turn-helix domain-containing protein [Lactobacillus delbrueckii subsp. bulgaricus]
MSDANKDIRETIWEYQVSYSELYRELGWPCGYSTLTNRINGDIALSSSKKQQIKESCERILKRRKLVDRLQAISQRELRSYIKNHGVKMQDIAKEIGISNSALSWCLTGKSKLTDKRRRDIIDAVDKIHKEQNYG